VLFANEPEWEMVGGAYALAETAIVKRGSRGVEVRTASGLEEHPPLGSEVVDTTGAGDAFLAAFAARLRFGESLFAAAAYAVRAATIKVERWGTMPSFATPAELSRR